MKRSTSNFVIDLVSLTLLLGLACTGLIIKFILPPGSGGHGFRGGRGTGEIKYLWSMTRHQWGDIHFYLAVGFVFLMVMHIILHWNWIKCYLKSIRPCPEDITEA